MEWLAFAWLGIIAFTFLLYIILDGFTLGVAMYTPWMSREQRDIAVSAILPTWDGNQTWLVFSLAALYGMFPLAFAFILPKIYLPAILLAIMIVFRGICFEFRLKSVKGVDNWDRLFALSSWTIAFLHGYLAGQVVFGYSDISIENGLIFKIATGIALAFGYMLLGTTRLMIKTEGAFFDKVKRASQHIRLGLVVLTAIVIILSALHKDFSHLTATKSWIIGALMLAVVALYFGYRWSLNSRYHWVAYWNTVTIFILLFLSMVVYIFPYIVPFEMTYLEAAAPPMTLGFTLIIAVIMIPLLLLYTGYAYYVFRGKTREKLHY